MTLDAFTPLTRRVIAIGLVVLVALSLTGLAGVMADSVLSAMSELEDVRFREARLQALLGRPLPPAGKPVRKDLLLRSKSHASAMTELQARINRASGAASLPLESASPNPQDASNPLAVEIAITANGPETSVLNFVNELEKGSPPARLRAWRIQPVKEEPGKMRLEGTVAAVWGGEA